MSTLKNEVVRATIRTIPQKAIDLIIKEEGFCSEVYLCPAGKETIGYGETDPSIITRYKATGITQVIAEKLLIDRLEELQQEILKIVTKPLNDNELSALLSFVYNIGLYNFASSTLLRKINELKPDEEIEYEFERWVYANKVKLNGLTKRRDAEAELFTTPIVS